MASKEDWLQYVVEEPQNETDWAQYAVNVPSEPVNNTVPETGRMASVLRSFKNIAGEPWETYTKPRFDAGFLSSGLTGFETASAEIPHGIIQALAGQNEGLASQEVARQRQERYETAKERDPYSAMIGYGAGKIAQNLPLISAGGAFASRGPSFLNYLSDALATTALGGAGGASEYVNPGESREMNAVRGALTNLGLKGAGSVLKGTKELGSSFMKTHPADEFAKRFVQTMKDQTASYSKKYRNIIKEGKGLPIDKPKINYKDIFENATKKEKKYLKKFIENPTIKNAHRAQSDLGKFQARLSKLDDTSSITDSKAAAKKAQKKLREAINKSFEQSGKPNLAQEYQSVTKGYGKDVIPYLENKSIDKFISGKLLAEDFRDALIKDKAFKAQLGKSEYPELYKMPKAIKAGEGALKAFGAYELGKYLGL